MCEVWLNIYLPACVRRTGSLCIFFCIDPLCYVGWWWIVGLSTRGGCVNRHNRHPGLRLWSHLHESGVICGVLGVDVIILSVLSLHAGAFDLLMRDVQKMGQLVVNGDDDGGSDDDTHYELVEFTTFDQRGGEWYIGCRWSAGDVTTEHLSNVAHCTELFEDLRDWVRDGCLSTGRRGRKRRREVGDRPGNVDVSVLERVEDMFPFQSSVVKGDCMAVAYVNAVGRFDREVHQSYVEGATMRAVQSWCRRDGIIRLGKKHQFLDGASRIQEFGRGIFYVIIQSVSGTKHAVVVDTRDTSVVMVDGTNPGPVVMNVASTMWIRAWCRAWEVVLM